MQIEKKKTLKEIIQLDDLFFFFVYMSLII